MLNSLLNLMANLTEYHLHIRDLPETPVFTEKEVSPFDHGKLSLHCPIRNVN
jgi:hypothetical protein